jgi:transcription initiation factor TFIID subunit 2
VGQKQINFMVILNLLSREGNYTQVRIAAFDGLFLTKWYTPQIMRYVLAIMANDPSRVIRRHVARNACYSLALLVQMGDMRSSSKEAESLLIEEDGNSQEKAKESKKSEMEAMIKVLRKDRELGKNEVLREFLMPITLYVFNRLLVCSPLIISRMPEIDHEVRWCILKLADLLIRPVDETPPSVKIHIPSTPVTDIAPQLPTVKAAPKVPRAIKSGGPPSKSPIITFNPPTKLKMPSSDIVSPRIVPPTPLAEIGKKAVVFATPEVPLKAATPKGRPAKPSTKPAHVSKAQSGGMHLNDLRASRNALKKLKANKHAALFIQPVDPIRDHAPK